MAKLSQLTKRISDISAGISDVVSDVLENVKTVVPDSIGKHTDDSRCSSKPIVIDSVEDLTEWIISVQPSASRSAALLLQSHLQIINYVSAPSITGMMVDNIIVSLYRSLEIAESETEKKLLQESYASLLQGAVFVSEARLHYEIKRNKDEAMMILSNASNMLAQSISNTAILVARSDKDERPVVSNIFDSASLHKRSLAQMVAIRNKSENIEELKKEHNMMLYNLFQTLDKYYSLIGPSIQIHGLLSRYVGPLVEEYKAGKKREIEAYISKFSMQWKAIMNEMNTSLYQEFGTTDTRRRVQGLVNTVNSLVNNKKLPDINTYEEINHLYIFLKERHSSLLTKVAAVKKEIASKQSQVSSLGIFQAGMKYSLNSELTELEKTSNELNLKIADIDEKIRVVEGVVLPINDDVDEYYTTLHKIAARYSIC